MIRLYSFHGVSPAPLADHGGMFERFTGAEHELVVTKTAARAVPPWPAEAP